MQIGAAIHRRIQKLAHRFRIDRPGFDRLDRPVDRVECRIVQRRQLADTDNPELRDVDPAFRIGMPELAVVFCLERGAYFGRRRIG